MLSACSHGVPSLTEQPIGQSGPTVQAVIKHIDCELSQANENSLGTLAAQKYLVNVNLLLQVDDNVDVTPSFSYIDPLKAASTNFTFVLAADVGGARRRTFTTTYTIGAAQLPPSKTACGDDVGVSGVKSELRGDLGIQEIVANGLMAKALGGGIITAAPDLTDKTVPSYGSQVQFVITRSITNLGPVWTLTHFKGPSGSSGLLNGKKQYTNTVTLGFAPQIPSAPAPSAATTAASARLAAVQSNIARLNDAIQASELSARAQVRPGKSMQELQLQLQIPRLNADLLSLEAERSSAEADLHAAQTEDERRAETVSRDAAATAAENLVTTMFLQNLSTGR
jgi:hypothetical protein